MRIEENYNKGVHKTIDQFVHYNNSTANSAEITTDFGPREADQR